MLSHESARRLLLLNLFVILVLIVGTFIFQQYTCGINEIFFYVLITLLFVLASISAYLCFYCKKNVPPLPSNEKELIHAARLASLGEMAPNIAHELNQPLCVVRGYMELLQLQIQDTDILKGKHMENVFPLCLGSVDHAVEIIDAFRKYARPVKSVKDTCCADKIFSAAYLFFHEQFKQHNIEIIREVEGGMPEIKIEPLRLEQIAVCLYSNARDSLDAKGVIQSDFTKKIRLKIWHNKKKNTINIEFIDNGLGMSSETINYCREPFFTTKKEAGIGLGVSIMLMIIKTAQGNCEIESIEGENCTFKLSFPAVSNDEPEAVH